MSLIAGSFLLLSGCTDAPETQAVEAAAETEALGWDQPDWVANAVIYELFTPDFTEEGTFRAIIPRLDELQELGVTTLWLMPIHPIGEEERKGVLGSPYAIRDYYGINPEYGTKEDFRALVDAVHERGMYLIIDLVANHTSPDNAWVEEHPDWYTRDADGNVMVPHTPDGQPTDWTDTVDLNYDNPELRAEMIRMMRYWVEEFNIDGYRCDVAGFVPHDFWAEAIAALREVKPIMMLAENEEPAIHNAGFDLTYAWPEYAKLKEVWNGNPVSELAALVQRVEEELPEGARRLRFTTNHDETAWDAPPPALFGGQEGAQAAFVLTATLPGVPLVYNGQETGVEETVPFFEQTPYDWSQQPEVRAFYERVLDLYNEHEVLRHGTLILLAPDAEDVMLFERTLADERVIVAVNVRNEEVSVVVPASVSGSDWTDALSGETVTLGESLTLPAYGYHVLHRVP